MNNAANKITKKLAEELAAKARQSLSYYCFSECKAYCCRKGYLLLKAKELKVMGIKRDDIMAEVEEGFVFDLSSKACPNLKDFKCKIHKKKERPKACKEFPLFIWENDTIMVSCRCPAVKENMLYPQLSEFKKRGYEILYKKE